MVARSTTTENPRSARRASRDFVRFLSGTIAILALLAAGLVVANFTQGPRLTASQINLDASIERIGARLSLTADQPLVAGAARSVTVDPKTDTTSSVSGNTLIVEFTGILRYNTRYTVTVDGVTGTFNDAASTLRHSFTTPDSRIYALQRDQRLDAAGAKRPDAVRRTTLRGRGDGEVVFSAPRIQEYAALDAHLAAVTLDGDGKASLEVVSFSGGSTVTVPLPSAGTVSHLRSSPSKHLIGYAFTSDPAARGRHFENTPFTYDLTESSGLPREVTGFDGLPMSVLDLDFVPGTTSLVVQAYSQTLYLVQAIGDASLTPLGIHSEMRGFIPGTRSLVVADPTQGSAIDLDDGKVTTLDLAASVLSEKAYPGKLTLIDGKGRYAQLFLRPTMNANVLNPAITVTGDTGSKIVLAPASEASRVRDFCVSPNGQYLAVETISAEGIADNYSSVPAFSAMSTVFLDLTTGTSTRGVSGFQPNWCG